MDIQQDRKKFTQIIIGSNYSQNNTKVWICNDSSYDLNMNKVKMYTKIFKNHRLSRDSYYVIHCIPNSNVAKIISYIENMSSAK